MNLKNSGLLANMMKKSTNIIGVPLYISSGLSADGMIVSGWNNSNRKAYIESPIDMPVVANKSFEINIKYYQSQWASWGWYVLDRGFKDRASDRYEFNDSVSLYINHPANQWTWVKMIFNVDSNKLKTGTIYVSFDGENWQTATGSKTITLEPYYSLNQKIYIGSISSGGESILSGSNAKIDFEHFSISYLGKTIVINQIITV